MEEIKLIDENTDLSKLEKYDWDIDIKGKKYNVYRLQGYCHRIGGKYGNNDLWCCPEDEIPTYNNLIEFDGFSCRWGFKIQQNNYIKNKWGETSVECNCICTIYRNDEEFMSFGTRDYEYAAAKAQVIITKLQEHPIYYASKKYIEEIEGRKIYYRNQKAIIERYIKGQNCAIISFESGKYEQPEYLKEEWPEDIEKEIKEDLLSKHIWWFRD